MRLIDADNLITVTDIREDGREITYVPYSEIEDASTAYDPVKVVEQLEDYSMWEELMIYELTYREREIIKKAVEIVRGGGVDGN